MIVKKDLVELKSIIKYVFTNIIKYYDESSLQEAFNVFRLEHYGFPEYEWLTTKDMLEILDIKYTCTDDVYSFDLNKINTGELVHLTYDGTYLYVPYNNKVEKYLCPISTLLFAEIMYAINGNQPIFQTIKEYFNLATE